MAKTYNINDINLDTINDTTGFFNNIFDQQISVSSEVDQSVLAFFEKKTGSKTSAKGLAGALLYTCLSRGIDPMTVLDRYQNLNENNLDVYTAMILNLSRVSTSVLGVVNVPTVSPYITRTIIA
jgi:hypothetical protein